MNEISTSHGSPEIPQKDRIQHITSMADGALQKRTIPLHDGGSRLVPTDKKMTVEEVKNATKIAEIQPTENQTALEQDMPTFIRNHTEDFAKLLLPDLYSQIVNENTATSAEQRLALLKALEEKVTTSEWAKALESFNVRFANNTDMSIASLASIQAAVIEEAQSAVRTITDVQEVTYTPSENKRRSVYSEMYTDLEGKLSLEGSLSQVSDYTLRFPRGDAQPPLEISSGLLLSALKESTYKRASPEAKQNAQDIFNLIKSRFGESETIKKFDELFQKSTQGTLSKDEEKEYYALVGRSTSKPTETLFDKLDTELKTNYQLPTLTDDQRKQMSAEELQKYNDDYRKISAEKNSYMSEKKLHTTVKEDLVMAQQLMNSLAPPTELVKIKKMEVERDRSTGAEHSRLAHDIVLARQKLYRALLSAYEVNTAEDLSPEEREIADTIKKRNNEVVTYRDMHNENRSTLRGSLNAIDANRISTLELLKELGCKTEHINFENFIAQRQAVVYEATQEAKNDFNNGNPDAKKNYDFYLRKKVREKWEASLRQELGILQPGSIEDETAMKIIQDRVQTEIKLYGTEHQIYDQANGVRYLAEGSQYQSVGASRFTAQTGVNVDNLSLTLMKDMGLKGIDLLYRRSKSNEKIRTGPTYPANLDKIKITLMKKEQLNDGGSLTSLLDQLKNTTISEQKKEPEIISSTPELPSVPVVPELPTPQNFSELPAHISEAQNVNNGVSSSEVPEIASSSTNQIDENQQIITPPKETPISERKPFSFTERLQLARQKGEKIASELKRLHMSREEQRTLVNALFKPFETPSSSPDNNENPEDTTIKPSEIREDTMRFEDQQEIPVDNFASQDTIGEALASISSIPPSPQTTETDVSPSSTEQLPISYEQHRESLIQTRARCIEAKQSDDRNAYFTMKEQYKREQAQTAQSWIEENKPEIIAASEEFKSNETRIIERIPEYKNNIVNIEKLITQLHENDAFRRDTAITALDMLHYILYTNSDFAESPEFQKTRVLYDRLKQMLQDMSQGTVYDSTDLKGKKMNEIPENVVGAIITESEDQIIEQVNKIAFIPEHKEIDGRGNRASVELKALEQSPQITEVDYVLHPQDSSGFYYPSGEGKEEHQLNQIAIKPLGEGKKFEIRYGYSIPMEKQSPIYNLRYIIDLENLYDEDGNIKVSKTNGEIDDIERRAVQMEFRNMKLADLLSQVKGVPGFEFKKP